jgi:hypothetical protein
MRTKFVLNRWMIVPLMAAFIVMVGGLDVHALEANPAWRLVPVYQEEVAGCEQPAMDTTHSCTGNSVPSQYSGGGNPWCDRSQVLMRNLRACLYCAIIISK